MLESNKKLNNGNCANGARKSPKYQARSGFGKKQ